MGVSGTSHPYQVAESRITGIRSWIGASTRLGAVVMMVQLVSGSPPFSHRSAVLRVLGATLIDGLVIGGALLTVFVLSVRLGWVVLAVLAGYGAILGRASRVIHQRQARVATTFGKVEAAYIDHLRGEGTIAGFAIGPAVAALDSALYGAFQRDSADLGRLQAHIGMWSECVAGVALVLVLYLGATDLAAGRLTLAALLACYSLLMTALPALARLIDATVALHGASVAAARVADVLQFEREPWPGHAMQAIETLELRDGVFSWPRGGPVLNGVRLRLSRGSLTAITGPSGAGKSTLVAVLQRRLRLTGGALLVDGRDATTLDLAAYRRQVAVVPEVVHIFSGTLYENITLGRSHYALADVQQLLERCGFAAAFERFEAGLATRVGDDGRHLSAGERQLVGLLRALLGDPAILIVDEGTNAVDRRLASCVHRVLRDYARKHAVCLISHQASTLALADRVLVLEQGRLAEDGAIRTEPNGRAAQVEGARIGHAPPRDDLHLGRTR